MADDQNYLAHIPGWLSAAGLTISGFFAKGYVRRIQQLEEAQKSLQTKEESASGRTELRQDITSLRTSMETGFADIQQALRGQTRGRR